MAFSTDRDVIGQRRVGLLDEIELVVGRLYDDCSGRFCCLEANQRWPRAPSLQAGNFSRFRRRISDAAEKKENYE